MKLITTFHTVVFITFPARLSVNEDAGLAIVCASITNPDNLHKEVKVQVKVSSGSATGMS